MLSFLMIEVQLTKIFFAFLTKIPKCSAMVALHASQTHANWALAPHTHWVPTSIERMCPYCKIKFYFAVILYNHLVKQRDFCRR